MSDTHYDPLDALFEDDTQSSGDEGKTPAELVPDLEKGKEKPATDETAGAATQEAPVVVTDPDADIVVEKDGVKMVPYAALKEARDRAKAAEARPAPNATTTAATEDKSDDDADPFNLGPVPERGTADYVDYVAASTQMTLLNDRLNRSYRDVAREHGKETADKVQAWATGRFEADPEYAASVLFDADPYAKALGDFNKETEKVTSELPGLNEEEKAAVLALRASKAPPETKVDPPRDAGSGQFRPRSPTPPAASLAKATPAAGKGGSGRDAIAVGPGVAFDDVFK